jgi:hypothetical protein
MLGPGNQEGIHGGSARTRGVPTAGLVPIFTFMTGSLAGLITKSVERIRGAPPSCERQIQSSTGNNNLRVVV